MAKAYIAKMNKFSESLPSRKVNVTVRRTPEVDMMASQVTRSHSKESMRMACLWLIACSILDHYHVSKGFDTQHMKDMLCSGLTLWCEKNGTPVSDVEAALGAIRQSGEVASYLASLPE